MLDVYRSYYGLSGEPFRLGPDYRFSLHHTSYANAKAYLNYAIYQGEGFIAITGEPGTGKTTLISEILATLDRTRVQVATLTSTQLESRDLLHMVASSFGMQPDRFDKADLVLEIENYLVKKIRSGQRAMLIVDEAQGLSNAALEELRLLANLQYQYQLLLQICLVGQKNLLDLIHAPGMEHLQQRLVAATSLEPLGFDETIDYIEHRLGKVGWKGDPAIDEAALRLIYRYSRGTPRRINLIVNRLFLYGGMEQKHRLVGADAENVIAGLMEEHLLGAQLAYDDSAIGPLAPGQAAKSRSLPRPGGTTAAKAAAAKGAAGEAETAGKRIPSASGGPRWDNDNLPGSRPQASTGGTAGQPRASADHTTQVRTRQPSFASNGTEPPPSDQRHVHRPAATEPEKKSGGKSLAMIALMLAGAGGAYYLYTNPDGLDSVRQVIGRHSAVGTPADGSTSTLPAADASSGSLAVLPGSGDVPGESVDIGQPTGGEKGSILRSQPVDDEATVVSDEGVLAATAEGRETAGDEPEPALLQAPGDKVVQTTDQSQDNPDKPAADNLAGTGETGHSELSPAHKANRGEKAAEAVAVAPASTAAAQPVVPEPVASTVTAMTAPPLAPPAVPNRSVAPDVDAITARREELRQAAERRFTRQLAQVQPDEPVMAPVTRTAPVASPAPPDAAAASMPASVPIVASQPKTSAPAPKKKPLTTAGDIKGILLSGRWSSSSKPASLLPSEATFCDERADGIHCISVPQNVKTQYGLALYKVESTLSGFSSEGLFEMSYRTLVKLVGSDAAGNRQTAGGVSENGWQVTEYAMSCKLADDNRVSCLDGKGITREYRRLPR